MKAPESDREALYLQIKTAGLSIVPAAASVAASCPRGAAERCADSRHEVPSHIAPVFGIMQCQSYETEGRHFQTTSEFQVWSYGPYRQAQA